MLEKNLIENCRKGGYTLSEKEIYDYLKRLNLMDIVNLIIRNSNYEKNSKSIEVYYTSKDLYRIYPNIFSKFKLDKYIREDNLPMIKEGKERLFLKSDIEKWLKNRSKIEYKKVEDQYE